MQLDFPAGCHISEAARLLVEAANEHGTASGTFNGITICAGPGVSPEKIVEGWDTETAARAEAYRNSPEGKRAAREAEERRARAQLRHDALMSTLPRLDMKNDAAVLDWLCDMQGPSDHSGVHIERQAIVRAFEKAGYAAGANCGEAYRPGDRDNEFRYLVGQALDGLKNGPAIHPIIHKFADEWRTTWLAKVGQCR